jgi:hypothetical protein
VLLTDAQRQRLRAAAAERERTIAELVRDALSPYIDPPVPPTGASAA